MFILPSSSKPEARKQYRQTTNRIFARKRQRSSVLDVQKYLDSVNLARLEESRKRDLRGY